MFSFPLYFGCNDSKGQDGISSDIRESKKRGVYICEYEPPKNPFIINDSMKIHVKSAWLEKTWKYPSNPNETVILKKYQLIVISDPKDLVGNTEAWTIGIDYDRNFYGCGSECMITEFKELPTKEIEVWKVQQGYYLNNEDEHKIIGEFKLIKK